MGEINENLGEIAAMIKNQIDANGIRHPGSKNPLGLGIVAANNTLCPVCFSAEIIIEPKTFKSSCICGWDGNFSDRISGYEAKNRKRTDLIDKMLE